MAVGDWGKPMGRGGQEPGPEGCIQVAGCGILCEVDE